MAQETNDVAALLEGMADEVAAIIRSQLDALKDAPVVSDPAAIDRTLKAAITLCRANLSVRAVKAAEDKLAADKAQRLTQMETMKMDDITPDELEQRADELRARIDRIMATLETKQRRAAMDRHDAGRAGPVDAGQPRRAA